MSVLIRIGGTKAIFRDGAWVSCDRSVELRLNAATVKWIEETGGPPVHSGDPERFCALAVADLVGGVVLRHVPVKSRRLHDFFMSRRQMKLEF